MQDYLRYQTGLLDLFRQKFVVKNYEQIATAFMKIPRHKFVPRFSPDRLRWFDVKPETVSRHLELLYADTTLLLFNDEEFVSTISQPTLVLKMLDLLDVKPGQRIFELGTGSGWNAAMLGVLTGENGAVISYEIIPEMVKRSRQCLSKFTLPQVEIVDQDALEGLKQQTPFDRGIFTAGAHDLSPIFFEKIKNTGLLLFVLKTSQVDLLLLLQKEDDHFNELERVYCTFVNVTGLEAPSPGSSLDELSSAGKLKIYLKQQAPDGAGYDGQYCRYLKEQNGD